MKKCAQIFLIVGLWTCLSASEEGPALRLLVGPDPPNAYLDNNGQVAGLAVSKVRHFMQTVGISYRIELVPWARALRETATRSDTAIFNIGRTDERESHYYWITPLSQFDDVLYARNDAQLAALSQDEIRSGQYTAACERDTMQCQSLLDYGFEDNSILRVSEVSADQLAELILRGRVDFIVINPTALNTDPTGVRVPEGSIVPIQTLRSTAAYLALPKSIDPNILDTLRAAVEKIENRQEH